MSLRIRALKLCTSRCRHLVMTILHKFKTMPTQAHAGRVDLCALADDRHAKAASRRQHRCSGGRLETAKACIISSKSLVARSGVTWQDRKIAWRADLSPRASSLFGGKTTYCRCGRDTCQQNLQPPRCSGSSFVGTILLAISCKHDSDGRLTTLVSEVFHSSSNRADR